MLDAGVVDEDVNPTKLQRGRRDHVENGFGLRHVRTAETDSDTELPAEVSTQGFHCIGIPKAVQHHISASPT
jgi:hypothetical protein